MHDQNNPTCLIYSIISHLYNFHTYRRKCILAISWHVDAFPIIIQLGATPLENVHFFYNLYKVKTATLLSVTV